MRWNTWGYQSGAESERLEKIYEVLLKIEENTRPKPDYDLKYGKPGTHCGKGICGKGEDHIGRCDY